MKKRNIPLYFRLLTSLLKISLFIFIPLVIGRGLTASSAYFTASATVFGDSTVYVDITPPAVPTLISPPNHTIRNTSGMVMDWSDVVDSPDPATPIYYLYQSARNPSFSPLAYQSGHLTSSQIPASGTADGLYYWRVKACDNLNNCSAWSDVWQVTVDNISPQVLLTSPSDISYVNGVVEIRGDVVDVNPHHYWLQVRRPDGSTFGPGTVNYSTSFTNRLLLTWDTTGMPDGQYLLKLEARDAANNKSPNLSPVPSDPEIVSDSVDWITVTVANTLPTTSLTDPDATFNTRSVTLNFQVDSGLTDYVAVCYDRNLSEDWQCPDSARSYSYPTGTFSLDLPDDGLYRFYSLGHNPLNTESSAGKPYVSYQIDSLPPTTMLGPSSVTTYTGQNLLSTVWDAFGTGDHHLTSFGYQIGFTDVAGSGTDGIYQIVSIPSRLSTTFSFAFRSLSSDSVDYANLRVVASSLTSPEELIILATGANESVPSSWTNDSGWRYYSRSLLGLAGQTIRISFTQTNSDPSQSSFSYIDSVRLSTLDTRASETETLDSASHDIGTGVIANNPSTTTTVGENVIALGVTDVATNSEVSHSVSVVSLPPLVLNRILFHQDQVELFNNSASTLDLSLYTLDCGSTQVPLTGTLAASTTTLASCHLDDSFATVSLLAGLSQVDTTTYHSLGDITEVWSRTPTGIGPWSLATTTLDFNLVSRPAVSKVTLSVANASSPVDYSIVYSNSVGLQEIAGNIPLSGLTSGHADRDLYLGTCSTNGTCTPDTVSLGSTIAVTVNTVTKTFTY